MVTKVYLIRHCQSMGNLGGRFQGRFDADVSPDGQKQLELLGLRFRNEHLDAVYTSPLLRARKTAQALAKYHPVDVTDEPGLLEIDVGDMENLLLSQVAERFPQVAWDWDNAPDQCRFPGGETMEEVYARVNAALDRIIQGNPGKTVAVATHGGALRNIWARVETGSPEGLRRSRVFGNTSVSLLEAEGGALHWRYTNDLSHLPEEMRKPRMYYRFDQGKGAEPV